MPQSAGSSRPCSWPILAATILAILVSPAASHAQPPVLVSSWDAGQIPLGLAVTPSGNVLVCGNDVRYGFREYSPFGSVVRVFADRDGFEAYGLAILSDGTYLVSQYYDHIVRAYAPDGTQLQQWSTGSSLAVYLAVDEQDHIYVTDPAWDQVRKFTRNGILLGSWSVPHPTGIACSGGVVYVAGRNSGKIYRFTTEGAPLGEFPSGATVAVQMTTDAFGRLYVADWGTYSLRCFDPSGSLLWHLAANVSGYPYGPVRFHSVAVAADGTVYAGDYTARRVLILSQPPTAAAGSSWGDVKRRYR